VAQSRGEAASATIEPMDDLRVGAASRAVRHRRRWRQEDVAVRDGVSASFVTLVERGHLDRVSLAALRRLAAVLDIRIDVVARWRGGELDRLLNARHAALHESVASRLLAIPRWQLALEVSFSLNGECGVIDMLAFHAASGCLLVIELKTAIVDVNELLGTLDRKRRLASRVAVERGWQATSVSSWLIIEAGRTNRRSVASHQRMLHSALPADGRTMLAWLPDPHGSISALSFWPSLTGGGLGPVQRHRVRAPAADAQALRA
jgi:transcriptional regulator with XRE-family HTH domain